MFLSYLYITLFPKGTPAIYNFLRIASLLLIFWLSISLNDATAANGVSNGGGNWNSAATWLFNGVNRVPACGDTLTILTHDTVTVNTQLNYSGCSSPINLIVDSAAVLQFTNGNKLDLPCGSIVQVLNKGVLRKAGSGGGNSTLISICSNTVWNSGDGTVNGPLTYTGSGLPVLWLGVNAMVEGKNVVVSWSTASEINNHFFTVEETADGIVYRTIGTADGAGNSTILHNYSMKDYSPAGGISYYRVKQTDYDGQVSYSRLVAVNFNSGDKGELKFFPNPASDYIYIAIPPSRDDAYMIHVFDMNGKEAIAPTAAFPQRNNLFNVDVSTLVGGVYIIQLVSEQETKWVKMMKE